MHDSRSAPPGGGRPCPRCSRPRSRWLRRWRRRPPRRIRIRGLLETANAALSRKAATEGMVLLENQNGALPIDGSGNVAVFGVGAYRAVKGGTGSGDANNR